MNPKNLFIIHYRHGKNPACWKVFEFNGTHEDAKKRAFRHCNIMGYSSPFVLPLISDLENEETTHLERKALTVIGNGVTG